MANEDRLTEHVLRYTTDEASVADSVRATERIKAGLVDVSQAARDASQPLADLSKVPASGAQQNVDALFDRLDDLEGVARAARQALGDAFDEAERGARRATDRVEDLARAERERAERARLYGDVESRTRAITGAVGYLGGEGFERTANIGAEMLAATEGIGLLRDELPKLTENLIESVGGVGNLAIGLGVASVAIAALGVGLHLLKERADESRAAVEAEIRFERELANLRLNEKTTEQLEEERRALQASIDARAGHILRLQQDREELYASLNPLEELGEATGLYNQGLDDLDAQLRELNTAQQADIKLRNEVIERIEENANAANDARAAEEALAKERRQASANLISILQERATREEEYARRAQNWSSEQVDTRLEQIEIERATQERLKEQYEQAYFAGQLTADAFKDATDAAEDRLQLLEEEVFMLDRMRPVVEAREAEAEALEAANKAQEERLDLMREEAEEMLARRDTFASFLTETKTAQEEHAQTLLEEEQDFQRERMRDWAAHYRDLAEMDADAARKEAEALDKLAEQEAEGRAEELKALAEHQRDRQRAAEDHQRRLRQIEDDAQFDFEEAARKRDTAGALAALRQGERALKQEDEQYSVAQQRREEDFNERLAELRAERDAKRQAGLEALADLREQHARERAERIADFQRRLQEEDQDRQIRLQRQQEAWQAEDEARRKHYAEQLGLTQKELQKIYNTSRTYLDGTSSAFSSAVRIIAGEANALLDAAQRASGFATGQYTYTGTKVKPPSKQKRPLGFADGGLPPVGEVVKVGERGPELAMFTDPVRVYSRQSAAPVQPTSVTVNLGGLGGVTVARTPGQSVRELAEAAGDGMRALVVDVLEDIIGEYAGDAA